MPPKANQFIRHPNVIRDARFHCWRNAQGLVDATEIVVHEPKRDRCRVILYLLGERVGQAGEPANAHSHAKVLALYIAGTYVLRIRISAYDFHVAADAPSGGVARFVFRRSAINVLRLCVINIRSERVLNRFQVGSVAVCSDLNSVADTACAIFHKLLRPS